MLKVDKEHEREAFAKMSFKEKVQHIASYYWVPIVSGLFLIFVLFWALNHYIWNPPAEVGLEFCVFASNIDDVHCEELEDRINERYSVRLGDKKFTTSILQDYGDDPIFQEQIQASVSRIIAMVSAGELDCIISSKKNIEAMGMNYYFIPLDEVLGTERLAEIEAYLKAQSSSDEVIIRTLIDNGKEELYPTAFCVSGIPAFDYLFTTVYDPYVAFIANSERLDFAADVICDLILESIE